MRMIDRLGSLIEELSSCVGHLDAGQISGSEAMELCARFAEVERLGAAGKLAMAERVAATEVWRRGGSRTAVDWLARQSGADPGRAREGLETAGRLGDCPVVAAEIRAGRLSEAQAHVIVDAAAVRPDAEGRLVEFARSNSLRRLREECRRVKVGDVSADEEYKAVHRSRGLRSWIGRDGAVCGSFRYTPDAGAELLAAIDARKDVLVRAAQRDGRREPFDAYAADALVELVTEARGAEQRSSSPKRMVIVHVAYEAIVRGAVADGEVCEIRGVGPVPLEAARRMAADSILRILVTKGGQPMAVTPGKRTVPRALRILLEARDKTCAVVDCDVTQGLQVEHRQDFALLGPTDLENCALVCPRHHDVKTYLGYRLVPAGESKWFLVPPDDYRDPEPPDPEVGPTVFFNPWTGRPSGADTAPESTAGSTAATPVGGPGRPPDGRGQLALVGADTSGPAP